MGLVGHVARNRCLQYTPRNSECALDQSVGYLVRFTYIDDRRSMLLLLQHFVGGDFRNPPSGLGQQ